MSVAVTCPQRAVLESFLIGSLDEVASGVIEEHLTGCSACVEALNQVRPQDPLFTAVRESPTKQSAETPVVHELIAQLSGLWSSPDEQTVGQAPARAGEQPHEATQEVVNFLSPPQAADEMGRLGTYRVLRVLGAGGMGLVFEAEDTVLQRRVALELLRPALAANPTSRQRFLREARLSAVLEHDHIVRIYQAGEVNGVLFLAMELLRGESLEARLKNATPLPTTEILRIGREMAEGLAVAHDRGLIHRDIKPSNVWLEGELGCVSTGRFRVKLLDFGLARALADNTEQTRSGVIMGTPAYLAPEQARGGAVDGRADLFALGCVLYRLVSGRLPFVGDDTLALLTSLAVDVPAPLRILKPDTSESLALLIMRLLEKNPAQRPATARAVVEELRQIETGPTHVVAPPPKPRARRATLRWVAAALALVLAAGIVIRIRTQDGKVIDIPVPPGAKVEIVEPKDKADALPWVPAARPGVSPFDAFQAGQLTDVQRTACTVQGKVPPELVAVLGDGRLQHWSPLHFVAWSPDGKTLASSGWEGVRVWDPDTGRQRFSLAATRQGTLTPLAFHPNGKWLAAAFFSKKDPSSFIRIVDAATGAEVRQLTGKRIPPMQNLAFSPDGKRLGFVVEKGAGMLDVDSGQLVWIVLQGLPGVIRHLAFSPDGRWLAVDPADNTVRFLDAATGEEARKLQVEVPWGTPMAFSPDGQRLVVCGQVSGWLDLSDKEARFQRLDLPALISLAYSPDGHKIVASTVHRDGELITLEATTFRKLDQVKINDTRSRVNALAIRPDGQMLAVGLDDGSLRLLPASGGQPSRAKDGKPAGVPLGLEGHFGAVSDVALLPDGRTLLSAGKDGTVRRWDLLTPPPQPGKVLFTHTAALLALAVSRDGRTAAVSDAGGKIHLLDVVTEKQGRTFTGDNAPVPALAFSPDAAQGGRGLLASGSISKTLRVWDLATQKLRFEYPIGISVAALAFSPDGRFVVASGTPGIAGVEAVSLVDTATGQEVRPLSLGRRDSPCSLAFSPDSRFLVTGASGRLYLHDVSTGAARDLWLNTKVAEGNIWDVAFHPQGEVIAAASEDGLIRLWDIRTGKLLRSIVAAPAGVKGWKVKFTPDGRHLLTANANGTITVLRLAGAPQQ